VTSRLGTAKLQTFFYSVSPDAQCCGAGYSSRIFTQNIRTLYAILYFEVDKVVLVVFSELSFRFGLNHSVPVSIPSVADPGSGAFLTPGSGIRNR
jgi:hypothetical protein